MKELIESYRSSLKAVREIQIQANELDRELLGSMASDLQFSIDWMRTGCKPGPRRGIERRSAYQREYLIDDPIKVQKYMIVLRGQAGALTLSEKERLEDALSVLTEREKEIYLMARGQCFSYDYIATLLNVSKSTVQDTMERAERKIKDRVENSIFCIAL